MLGQCYGSGGRAGFSRDARALARLLAVGGATAGGRLVQWCGRVRTICARCGRMPAEARALERHPLRARRPLPGAHDFRALGRYAPALATAPGWTGAHVARVDFGSPLTVRASGGHVTHAFRHAARFYGLGPSVERSVPGARCSFPFCLWWLAAPIYPGRFRPLASRFGRLVPLTCGAGGSCGYSCSQGVRRPRIPIRSLWMRTLTCRRLGIGIASVREELRPRGRRAETQAARRGPGGLRQDDGEVEEGADGAQARRGEHREVRGRLQQRHHKAGCVFVGVCVCTCAFIAMLAAKASSWHCGRLLGPCVFVWVGRV